MKINSLSLAGGLFLVTAFVTFLLHAQNPPQAINYQAVARDAGGNLITTPLTVRMSLRQGSASGAVVYQETHNVTPNTYGLFNLSVGQGTVLSGSFSGIDWSAGPYFAQVEVNSGSGYVNMGTQQMLSVPYALYSGQANSVDPSYLAAQSWQLGGNSVTASDFLGTTNAEPLRFRANSQMAGHVGLGGDGSTLFGYQAGNSDDGSDNWNTFVGYQAGFSSTVAEGNVGVGFRALYSNTTGYQNTAAGVSALISNTTGYQNTATGLAALYSNTTGYSNTAAGMWALYSNTTQSYATAFGYSAGDYFVSANSAFFGANAYPSAGGYSNVAGLGYDAHPTASNQVRVGNNSVTSIGGFANWTNVSDARYKKDVQENVPGLDFISRLRPVTYHLDVTGLAQFLGEGEFRPKREGREEKMDETTIASDRQARAEKEKILYTGFIAQEVEKAARELGYDFSGVDKPQNEKSLYGLRYAEFVVPLVKAVQEQQKIIEEQRSRIDTLEKELMQVKMQLEASAQKTK